MATRYSTAKSPPREKPAASSAAEHPLAVPAAEIAALAAERRRLQKVHSLLGCVIAALDDDRRDIDYADVIDIARHLVSESITGVDSVIMRLPGAE